jgi:hypothetical protein
MICQLAIKIVRTPKIQGGKGRSGGTQKRVWH